ncbi:intradiol ring-cleavage dioxygenase [Zoogloea sp.]|jgi:protocatechuate 3,4-dioxygenase beta subunit|uniref:intradiol ring-cleavage dioxygenase n=1 Tax=Zoogloea sp. TaxID=49181 RepID=UPI0011D8CF35|nr:intradiol ring-cleavage dioxygenase [Zoogloea sp.]MBK6652758.1 intradiol ring-cleavage dioxygenase [Zoogloea sp.]MBP7444270.1 intradiol ring-cleavage dioxygenase [Zoogloea sp.]TXG88740.1 MAG: intradiol ring-cleavage dioxygenase [Zoogloea sp.]HOY02556.1 intradiol ring-cleavage dioxygenase [Zoogloea sp.]
MPIPRRALANDLEALLRTAPERRQILRWLLAGASAPLAACGGGAEVSIGGVGSSTGSSSSDTASTVSTCTIIPEETAGPYPGDGSNYNSNGIANALSLSGIVRSDIRSSIGGATGTAAGIPLTLTLQLVNTAGNCANLAGYAIYLWHCTRDGLYSMYSTGVTGENFLRGVQQTDSNGKATFLTIFPGCYAGRMPHMHFEVYPSLASATGAANKVKTSQIAFPTATCNDVYATSGYGNSAINLAAISFASDNVFSDGTEQQMASISGTTTNGYSASLVVGIAS